MVEKIANFILELVPAPGTGNFTLGTPVVGRLPWSAGVSLGLFVSPAEVFYFANDTTQQEWGIGTYTAGLLTRNTVLGNSAGSTAKINFATLPVYVYPEIPAERSVYRDPATGNLITAYGLDFGSAVTPSGNANDLSRHINLYGGAVGLSVTTNRLNLVTGSVAAVVMVAGSTDIANFSSTGLVVTGGLTATGSITTTANSSALNLIAVGAGGGDVRSYSQNSGPLAGFRNRLINSAFSINQRTYVSGTAVGAGVYTLDRWKAGAGGCTFTFAASAFTTITITAGTLQQVIEGNSIEGGVYTLSWLGSAQGRIDGGAYGASPVTSGSLATGVTHTVEFSTGSVLLAQFEPGPVATKWEMRHIAAEQLLCDRYFVHAYLFATGYNSQSGNFYVPKDLPTRMRVNPTIIATNGSGLINCDTVSPLISDQRNFILSVHALAAGAFSWNGTYDASAEL